jgi:hypothetical protein
MDEQTLLKMLRGIGIHEYKKQRSGWVDFSCPLAPFTHKSGADRSMSAGAKIAPGGISGWKCHACKNHGRIPQLILRLGRARGIRYTDLLHEAELAEAVPEMRTGFGEFECEVVDNTPTPLQEEQYEGLFDEASEDPDAMTYITQRGISAATAHSLNLLWDPEKRRVLFPVRGAQSQLWGFTGRAVDPGVEPKIKDYYGLPKRHVILGENRWVRGKPIIVVEGLFGYAHLVEIGVEERANVGAILGSTLTVEKAEILRNWNENTYLLFDNDAGGDTGLFGHFDEDGRRVTDLAAVNQLHEYVPIYVPGWPEGKDDPDQLTCEEVFEMLDTTPLFHLTNNL